MRATAHSKVSYIVSFVSVRLCGFSKAPVIPAVV